MSKLPNAPLLEVVFELRWKITNKLDLDKCQYVHGDLYSLLKSEYPHRESLLPSVIPADVLINNPVHRFRKAKNDYPLFQVGPGLLTLNTIDEKYFWDEYFKRIESLVNAFFQIYPFAENEKFQPNLLYFDFFKLDFEKENVIDFINKYLSLEIAQSFYKTDRLPNSFNFNLSFDTKFGQFSLAFNSGKNSKQEQGLILQTKINGNEYEPNIEQILSWLQNSHDFCSSLFKEITKGELYKTFK